MNSEDLLKQVQALEAEVQVLRAELAQANAHIKEAVASWSLDKANSPDYTFCNDFHIVDLIPYIGIWR